MNVFVQTQIYPKVCKKIYFCASLDLFYFISAVTLHEIETTPPFCLYDRRLFYVTTLESKMACKTKTLQITP